MSSFALLRTTPRGIEPLGMTDRIRPFGFTSKLACELSEVFTEKENRMTKRRK
jgi:hypothetical protein